MAYVPEYQAWRNMKDRCRNPNHRSFARYGGRGIDYDPRWESFDAFIADMGFKPHRGLSLERRDNDRGYCKENCTWASPRAQSWNSTVAKLSPEKARTLRRMYATGRYAQYELMARFDVTWATIRKVLKYKAWKP